MDVLWQDIRFALRTLVKNPGFTAIAVLTLALGIGANASIFSVLNGVLLRPLRYKDPDKLITFRTDFRGNNRQPGLSGAEVLKIHEQSRQIEDVAIIVRVDASLTGEQMEPLVGARISENFLPVLGVSPMLGRNLDVKVDRGTAHPNGVIISYDLWKKVFNADPKAVGRPIEINNYNTTVVGVMPRDFRLHFGPGVIIPSNVDIYFPGDITPQSVRGNSVDHYIVSVGRLKPGVTFAQAQQEIDGIAEQVITQYPKSYEHSNLKIHLVALHADVVQDIKPAILAMLGAVIFVLLIGCSNVANMLLARGKAREKELVIRAALGAERTRIIRQLLTESLLLGLLGGVAGLLLASWGISFLLYLRPKNLPRQDDITLNWTVLVYALIVSVVAGLIFGLAPAWKATRFDINETLKEGVRGSGAGSGERLRGALVVAQVALSLILFVGAGLMIRTFANLNQVNLGFNPNNVLTFAVPLNSGTLQSPEARLTVYQNAMDRVKSLPGVESVGAVSPMPLSGALFQKTYASNEGSNHIRTAAFYAVLPGYFESMRIKLLYGRYFTDHDDRQNQNTIIVDSSLAEGNWPGENPVGKRILLNAKAWAEIIGVVEHVRMDGPLRESGEQIYLPYLSESNFIMTFTVRGKGDMTALVGPIRKEVEGLGGGRPINSIKMMNEYVADATADSRFALLLLSILAFVALVLCSVGLYAVMSYSVSQRVPEIGIRTALGARPADILKMIVGKGLTLTIIGVVVGLGGAFAITRLMTNLLFKVGATDPATFIGVAALLIAVGLTACFIPARRAARIDPMTALR